ncbi:MAG TPA: ABC-type transport auxiliary lipoprotein family protein [Casimicrobiaceae bacterium]
MRTYTIVALAALVLAGCTLSRPAPVKQQYLLDPPAPAAVSKSQPTSVRVGGINVAAPFRGRNLVLREADLRYETDYYNEFLVPPATMIAELTTRALERSKAFARVVPPGYSSEADWVLDGFVSALYADERDGKKLSADVAVSYYLFQSGGGSGMPVWTHDYQKHVALTGANTDAYAAALNAAFGEIFTELTRDLAAADLSAAKR